MSNATGSITLNVAGTGRTFSGLSFQPTKLKFTVGANSGSSATQTFCTGAVDSGGTQWVITEYDDHAGNYTYNTDQSNCVWLRKHTSGWVDELKASFNSFTSDGFKLNVTTANANYSVFFEASN